MIKEVCKVHLGVFQSCSNGSLVLKCKICEKTWTVLCSRYKYECSEKIVREIEDVYITEGYSNE